MYGFIENKEELYKYKWVNSFVSVFLVLYMNESLLTENDTPYITKNKGFTIITILHKGLKKSFPHPRDEDL